MRKVFFSLSVAALFFMVTVSSGCHEDAPPACEHKAFYLGTAVCPVMNGEIGLSIGDQTYIAVNFSDYANIDDYEFGDSVKINFTVTAEFPPGLLCGPTILGDAIKITCFKDY